MLRGQRFCGIGCSSGCVRVPAQVAQPVGVGSPPKPDRAELEDGYCGRSLKWVV
jgi:hypothetical protein